MANQYALQDQNAQFAAIAHSGTADTADTIRLVATTAGALTVDLAAGETINIGTVNLGTITRIDKIGTLEFGTVSTTLALNTGTITTIAAGTQNTLGTVGVVNAIVAGTQNTLGTVGVINNLVTGTLASVGTNVGVGVVSNLTNGSVNILTGTVTSVGTNVGVGVVSNLTNGSVNVITGTVTSVGNIVGGTLQVNPVPIPQVLLHGTLGTAGGSFFATVSAASGAGTKHYVSGVDVVMQSGTADVRVLVGTALQGGSVLAAGQFVPSGGIAKSFNPVFATGTNSELIYHFVGAGTAFITVSYWKGV